MGAAYSAYMERPWLSRFVIRGAWGGNIAPFYESMEAIANMPPGTTIVDCPCGAGPAFRAIPRGRLLRYIAVDSSPAMLRRARRRARARGLSTIEFMRADASELPLADGSADLFLSYWGLHCFQRPQAAILEAARVLAPAGRLVAATFVRGNSGLRNRLLIRPNRGPFRQIPTVREVERWIFDAGLRLGTTECCGPLYYFCADLT
jgi:ubiquinone/menaquinone biosynthesis C-methylase UbiE